MSREGTLLVILQVRAVELPGLLDSQWREALELINQVIIAAASMDFGGSDGQKE
jgi:hypothetical protein